MATMALDSRADEPARRKLVPVEATGPNAWADYLIRGDASGMNPEEIRKADAFVTECLDGHRPLASIDAGFVTRPDSWRVKQSSCDCQRYTSLVPSEKRPWEMRLQRRAAKWAEQDREAEREEQADRNRKRRGKFIFWLGVAPFLLFISFAMHESAWLNGYNEGWKASAAGKPFGELPDAPE